MVIKKIQFTNTPINDLAVLGPSIQNGHCLRTFVCGFHLINVIIKEMKNEKRKKE